MRELVIALALLGFGLGAQAQTCAIQAYFSPGGGTLSALLALIGSARTSVEMAAYGLTEPRIGKALADAHKRGVRVQVLVDTEHNGRRAEGTPSVAGYLAGIGVPVKVVSAYKIHHNKYLVIDGQHVVTGSYNFTRAAETQNAENTVVISQCPELAAKYQSNWASLSARSTGLPADPVYKGVNGDVPHGHSDKAARAIRALEHLIR